MPLQGPRLKKWKFCFCNYYSPKEVSTVNNTPAPAQRQTRQKRILWGLLVSASTPMSAEQLLKSARQACPTMALTTVYRNLEQLMAQESVQRIMYPDGTARYEAVQAVHHHYLICLECKKSIQLPMCPVNQLEQSIVEETGYEITSHNLELFGYCPACQQLRKQRQLQQQQQNPGMFVNPTTL